MYLVKITFQTETMQWTLQEESAATITRFSSYEGISSEFSTDLKASE